MATLIKTFSIPPSLYSEGQEWRLFVSMAVAGLVALALYVGVAAREPSSYPGFPMVGKEASERTNSAAQQRWMASAKSIVYSALEHTTKPFQVIGSSGPLLILPPQYITEIRTDERMTFAQWLKKDFFTTYPGFEGFKPAVDNHVFVDSVRVGLTQTLGHVVRILVEETQTSIKELFPRTSEWQSNHFDQSALRMIARLSSRTFLPEPLCHNEEWLKIAVEYTLDFFYGAYALRMFPPFLRPFVHWFLPWTRKLRQSVKKSRQLMDPVLKEREKERQDAVRAGKEPPVHTDAIEWIYQSSLKSGEYCDPVYGQLNYTLGAVHTTTVTFVNVLYNVVDNPEYIDLLREELIEVWKTSDGWTKNTLQRLKLMDSVMKESNRLHPSTLMSVARVAEEEVRLKDGTVIPKGAALTVPNYRLTDPQYYDDPLKFNGHRFYDMRKQPGNESKHQFVTTSDDYLPFGHGKHACPGRFFASNEIKILLAHLLLQFDWKFPEDQGRPAVKYFGLDRGTDPTARILYKARTPEVDLNL